MPESNEKPLVEIQQHDAQQPSQSAPEVQDNEKLTVDHLNVGRDGNSDGASNSTTLTTTPLVQSSHPEPDTERDARPEPDPDSALGRFNSITRRDGRHLQEPPSLPFNLRDHKLSLSIFTFLALAECCFVPVAFYYGFSQGTNVRSGMYILGKSCGALTLTSNSRNLFRNYYQLVWFCEWVRVRYPRLAAC